MKQLREILVPELVSNYTTPPVEIIVNATESENTWLRQFNDVMAKETDLQTASRRFRTKKRASYYIWTNLRSWDDCTLI